MAANTFPNGSKSPRDPSVADESDNVRESDIVNNRNDSLANGSQSLGGMQVQQQQQQLNTQQGQPMTNQSLNAPQQHQPEVRASGLTVKTSMMTASSPGQDSSVSKNNDSLLVEQLK